MFRLILNIAAALSLVMLCALVAIWWRGQSVSDRLSHPIDDAEIRLSTGNDAIAFIYSRPPLNDSGDTGWSTRSARSVRMEDTSLFDRPDWEILGVQKLTTDHGYLLPTGQPVWTGKEVTVTIPYWLPMSVTSILPFIVVLRRIHHLARKRRRLLNNLCLACGYDLRSGPTQPCPECGRKRATTQPAR